MNINLGKNILALSISAILLTACGGSSTPSELVDGTDGGDAEVAKLLDDGLHYVDYECISYNPNQVCIEVIFKSYTVTDTDNTLSENIYEFTNGAWSVVQNENDKGIYLGESGWSLLGDGASDAVVSNSTESGYVVTEANGSQFSLSATSSELEGKKISVVDIWDRGLTLPAMIGDTVFGDTVFNTGALSYSLTFTYLKDRYKLSYWGDENGNCDTWNGNCNTVRTPTGLVATTLDDIFFDDLATAGVTSNFWFEDGFSAQIEAAAQGETTGKANILFQNNMGVTTKTPTTWSLIKPTGTGEGIVVIEIPASHQEDLAKEGYPVGSKLIVSVHDGYVRLGEFNPANTVETDITSNLNKAAYDDLTEAIAAYYSNLP